MMDLIVLCSNNMKFNFEYFTDDVDDGVMRTDM